MKIRFELDQEDNTYFTTYCAGGSIGILFWRSGAVQGEQTYTTYYAESTKYSVITLKLLLR